MKHRKFVVMGAGTVGFHLAQALSAEGHQVTVVGDGKSAAAELAKQPFDLLITDIRMPGMDGIELLKVDKDMHSAIEVIVIFMITFIPALSMTVPRWLGFA